jgi:hypothetical protein
MSITYQLGKNKYKGNFAKFSVGTYQKQIPPIFGFKKVGLLHYQTQGAWVWQRCQTHDA